MGSKTTSFNRMRFLAVASVALAVVAVAAALALPSTAHAAALQATGADTLCDQGTLSAQALTAGTVSKTVKKQEFTTSTKIIKKKAVAVKAGKTTLKVKKGQGYVKYTANKTKKYKFTFSNFKSSRSSTAFVEVQLKQTAYPAYSFMEQVSTKGGKSNTLWLAKKGYQSKTGNLVGRCLVKRTGAIKLKKGQDIYFYIYSSQYASSVVLNVA